MLWTAIAHLQKAKPDVISLVYSGDYPTASKQEILSKINVSYRNDGIAQKLTERNASRSSSTQIHSTLSLFDRGIWWMICIGVDSPCWVNLWVVSTSFGKGFAVKKDCGEICISVSLSASCVVELMNRHHGIRVYFSHCSSFGWVGHRHWHIYPLSYCQRRYGRTSQDSVVWN